MLYISLIHQVGSRISTSFMGLNGYINFFNSYIDGKHSWFVDLKNGSGSAGTGPAPVTPDTTLTANLNDVFDIITGKMSHFCVLLLVMLFHVWI